MEASVAISYFHRKIGPMVYYSYPELMLDEKQKIRLADIMDQAFEEGFFTHKFSNLYSMNYYFEIPSEWARGNKEMLMLSIIVDTLAGTKVEATINSWCEDFANRMKMENGAFKAFYDTDDPQVNEEDIGEMKKYIKKIEMWLQELYWLAIEELREKSEEEKWAEIMNQPQIFKVINKLSKGPLKKENLRVWFQTLFPEYDFERVFRKLEEEKFIFSNVIGHETFVLLVKKVNITRVPPNCVIDLKEYNPELEDLTQIYINEVADFFEAYKPNSLDGFELFKLISNPKIYNVISQLRSGPLSKEKVLSMVSEKTKNELQIILKMLEKREIIQEFSYSGEKLYLLKTDIALKATFPEYLKKLIPGDSPYSPIHEQANKEAKDKQEIKEVQTIEGKDPIIFEADQMDIKSSPEINDLDGDLTILESDLNRSKDILSDSAKPSFALSKEDNIEIRKMKNDGKKEGSQSSYLFSLDLDEDSQPENQAEIAEQFKKLLAQDGLSQDQK